MDEAVKHALEIVKAQAAFRPMSEDEISAIIRAVALTVRKLEESERAPLSDIFDPQGAQIADKAVTCLECGKPFRLLTKRHLLSHGLSPEDYREKWNYPKGVPLVCKNLQRERRRKMKDMKLWEKRRKPAQ